MLIIRLRKGQLGLFGGETGPRSTHIQVRAHVRQTEAGLVPVTAHTRLVDAAAPAPHSFRVDKLAHITSERREGEDMPLLVYRAPAPVPEPTPQPAAPAPAPDPAPAKAPRSTAARAPVNAKELDTPLTASEAAQLVRRLDERGTKLRDQAAPILNAERRQGTYRQQATSARMTERGMSLDKMGQRLQRTARMIEQGDIEPTRFHALLPSDSMRDTLANAVRMEHYQIEAQQEYGRSLYPDRPFEVWRGARSRAKVEASLAYNQQQLRERDEQLAVFDALRAAGADPAGEFQRRGWDYSPDKTPDRARATIAYWRDRASESIRQDTEHLQYKAPLDEFMTWDEDIGYLEVSPEALAAADAALKAGGEDKALQETRDEIRKRLAVGWRHPGDRARVAHRYRAWLDSTSQTTSAPVRGAAARPAADSTHEQRRAMAEQAQRRFYVPADQQGIPGFFPTPPIVGAEMVELLDLRPGMRVLEPSAGNGTLAERVPSGVDLDVAEFSNKLAGELAAKGFNVVGHDALAVVGQYDRVLMNPPFEHFQDGEHVRAAFDRNLKPGGRIVALVGPSLMSADTRKAREFRDAIGPFVVMQKLLPEKSFAKSGTQVRPMLLVIDKPRS